MRYPPVPDDRRHAVGEFLHALRRYWLTTNGSGLTGRALVRTATVGQAYAGRILRGEVAMPVEVFQQIVGEEPPADLRDAYHRAYGQPVPDGRTPASDHGNSYGSDGPDVVAAVSRSAVHEANTLLDTGDARSFRLRLQDVYVPRRFADAKDLRTEADLVARCGSSTVMVVVGEPGTGKTSLMWKLMERLTDAGRLAWLVSATDLAGAEPRLRVADLVEALHGVTAGQAPVLLVDTVDVLLRSGKLPPLVDDLVKAVARAHGALVMTCREREFEVLRRHRRDLDFETVKLAVFDDEELPLAVERYARHFFAEQTYDPKHIADAVMSAVTRGLPIAHVCRIPLTLRMLLEVARLEALTLPAGHIREQPVETELDVTDLFAKYWWLRVVTDGRNNQTSDGEVDASRVAHCLAVAMLAVGAPHVQPEEVDRDIRRQALEALIRRSVVHRLDGYAGYVLEFFHQAFFEYAAARAIVDMGPDAITALVERTTLLPDDAFLAAITHQTLVYACRSQVDSSRVDHAFAHLLDCTHAGVRQTAIAAYAQAKFRGPRTAAAGRRLLGQAGDGLVRRYLQYIARVRHGDIGSVIEDIVVAWRHDFHEVRADVIDALRSLAAQHPERVLGIVGDGEALDWLPWYETLTHKEAQRHRNKVLGLLQVLADVDAEWCADRLRAVAARVMDKGREQAKDTGTQDALASVLTTAAQCRVPPEHLRRLLTIVPSRMRTDPSGSAQLTLAVAAIIRQVWLAEEVDASAAAAALFAPPAPDQVDAFTMLASDHGWVAPEWLARRSRLWALAEIAHEQEPVPIEAMVSTLLADAPPNALTDLAHAFLRRLLEGEHRPRLLGAPPPTSGSTTRLARALCTRQLQAFAGPIPQHRARGRTDVIWREALDHANLPPEEVADIAREVTTDPAASGWLRDDALAAIVVPAALGGHPGAAAALTRWSSRSSPIPDDRVNARKIIAWRLSRHAPTTPRHAST